MLTLDEVLVRLQRIRAADNVGGLPVVVCAADSFGIQVEADVHSIEVNRDDPDTPVVCIVGDDAS